MTLQELWDKLLAPAGAQDLVIAGVYAPHIAELSDDLGDLYEPQEYPKWVGNRVVHSADEEAALTAPVVADETAPAAAEQPAAQTPATLTLAPNAPEALLEGGAQ